MRFAKFRPHRRPWSRWTRLISLTLCGALFSPALSALTGKANSGVLTAPRHSYGWASQARPTPTPVDGQRQISAGPYVPAALRPESAARRANGESGKRVNPPPAKRAAPMANLPNLSESRKIRRSTETKRAAVTSTKTAATEGATRKTDSMVSPQMEMACADCDPSGGGGASGAFPDDPYFGTARTEPKNETGAPGVTLGSRNFNWSMPLVSLPGRAGMDLSISLYYNSLVWTRQGNAIQYNADHGTPAPGFQLGMPRLQDKFVDSNDNIDTYLMVTPSGGRVEMKRVLSTEVFESVDSSNTQLTFSGTTPVVRTTDGTQFIFGTAVTKEWRCTQIEDRNGNYISATYNSTNGQISTITDTLARTLDFNYNGDGSLETITQDWSGDTYTWVTFVYTEVQMSLNFSPLTVYGATNNGNKTVLSHIAFSENTSYHFDYNPYGQVYQIRHKAPDGHELEHTFYNIDNPGTEYAQTDCPRFTERHEHAQDWNDDHDAITVYEVTTGATWTNPETSATETGTRVQVTTPDNLFYREYSHSTGWDAGLTRLTEVLSAGLKKWTSTNWTQANTSLSYPQNPRVTEINIYDDASNRRRTTVSYDQDYNLPSSISEYSGASEQTLLRTTTISYVTDSEYLTRRIIGLPLERSILDASGNIVSKQDYQYDWGGDEYFSAQQPATNFDSEYYSSLFRIGRGNLSAVRRYDCTNNTTAGNAGLAIYTQRMGYNLAGSMVLTADASDHKTTISYTDNFSDSNKNQGTLAYPTTVTDPDLYSSSAQYEYDYGAITLTHVPTSGTGQSINYMNVVKSYDDYGRIEQITNQVNNTDIAYTRFDYELDANYVHTYQTVIDLTQANEFHSWQILDGAGRVRATASDHPGSTGGYTGQTVIYDNMGRVVEQSNPTEFLVNAQDEWVAAGDDAYNAQTGEGGWRTTLQTYDWKGRPWQTTNPDGTTRTITYGGCGCAGGEMTLAQDEHGRERRFTKDVLGRLATVEEMVWSSGTVYATTSYSYNARDQITQIDQRNQSTQANVQRRFEYDGHGRLKKRTTPEQGETNYSYYADDMTHVVTDARNVTTTYTYNHRHQVTSLEYNVSGDPNGLTVATPNAGFEYDSAGNRTRMTDGQGETNYAYNSLGQMTSETRQIIDPVAPYLNASYALSYEYNLAGELKKITNSWSSAEVNYSFDKAGRLTSVGGAGYQGVTNYASSLSYRAFGAIKAMNFGDTHSLSTSYDRNLRTTKWDVSGVLGYNYQYDGYYHERTGRVIYAGSIYDNKQDRSYEYDLVGRLAVSHSGAEARDHVIGGSEHPWEILDGPYSQGYDYDVWGNVTHRYGWGGEEQGGGAGQSSDITYSYSGNRRTNTNFAYDLAGNLKSDGTQTYAYDATGQQTSATWSAGSYTPSFTDDPLNPPNQPKTDIKLVHLTELRAEVNKLRARAGLAAVTNWSPDPNPVQNVTIVDHRHIQQLRTKLEEAYNALHLSIGTYAHAGPNHDDPIYAVDFQELRTKIKDAWTALSSSWVTTQSYDGNGLRVKKNEYGTVTYYLRSTVLGGQVVAELNSSGGWRRGYVYSGSSLLAVQDSGVFWVHEDPITKSKRVTDASGVTVSAVELDPWGADTDKSWAQAFQPQKYTSYERDLNGGDDAMFRRYNRKHARFDQPDPYDGSYDLADPQSLNRYAYVQNDPTNFTDPTGRVMSEFCGAEYSFTACGGNGGFWGGNFGGDVARYNGEYGGLPPNVASALAGYNQRVQNSIDANRANAAYQQAVRSGRPEDMARALAMIKANPTLQLVPVLSKADMAALAWFAAKYGQGAADEMLFNAINALTGLANYIRGYDYDSATRTFSVNFTGDVSKFLANSPYFAGPGIALLHLDVGTFDYRSYTDMTGGLSMQVVLGNDLRRSYADFDKINPYQDVVGFVRHNVPIIFRRIGRIFK